MYKLFFVCFFMFLLCINANSQTLDTINLGTSEQQFIDSIALLNEQNEQLKASRDAYNAGLLLLENENYIDAIGYFTNAILIDSVFVAAYLSRAKCYQGSNDELAIVDYRTVFSLDSTNLKPLYSVAALQLKSEKVLAAETYQIIISFNKTEYKAYSQLGVIAFLAKEYQEAEQLFTQSLAINKNAYAFNDRGSCYRKLEQFDVAIQDYLSAIALNNNLAFVYNNLASVYTKQDETTKALSYYDLAISKDVNYALAYNNKASLLLENKEYDKANLAIEKALISNSEYAPAYNNKGVIYHQFKKYNDAIAEFDKAIRLDINYAKAYLNRGISKQMVRDEDGACSDWNKAKELGIIMAKKYLENDCE
jgi:tetratricopeptide (TPR) repeat protein